MRTYPKYLDWLRYLSSFWLYFYGCSKVFGNQLTAPAGMGLQPIGSLSGYWLTWYYYGYSPTYKVILGMTQLLGASLLLFRKSSLLGAALMTPVMLNIVLINIFYSISLGAEINALFLLGSMLLILWHQHRELLAVFWSSQASEPAEARTLHRAIRYGIVAVAAAEAILGLVVMALRYCVHHGLR